MRGVPSPSKDLFLHKSFLDKADMRKPSDAFCAGSFIRFDSQIPGSPADRVEGQEPPWPGVHSAGQMDMFDFDI